MAVYLVRHADARSREKWDGSDRQRPLTKKGRRQADGIADAFRDMGLRRLLSSPATRCLETLQPLAARLDITVVEAEELFEGASTCAAYELLGREADAHGDVALCTHGDLIPELLDAAVRDGLRLQDPPRWAKGSTWVLERDSTRFTTARYVPPPD